MAITSIVADERTGQTVQVVRGNALAVSQPHPSLSFNAELAEDDTVVNLVPAKADHVFCLTGLLLTGNRNISTTVDASVEIYTADSETTAAANALVSLFVIPVAQSSSRDTTGILVEAAEGKWINAVTSDDDVFVTALGYYLKVN
jgi:hypothetical protein